MRSEVLIFIFYLSCIKKGKVSNKIIIVIHCTVQGSDTRRKQLLYDVTCVTCGDRLPLFWVKSYTIIPKIHDFNIFMP